MLLDAEPGPPKARNVRVAANRARVEQQRLYRERLPDIDVATIDWERTPSTAARRADLPSIAIAALGQPVTPVHLVSRGPRRLSNRWAHALEDSLVAHLDLGVNLGRGRHGLRASTTGRRGRRLLGALHAEPGWAMVRQSSDHFIATRTIPTRPDPRQTALLHATVADDVLARLGWPLTAWRVIDGPRPAG